MIADGASAPAGFRWERGYERAAHIAAGDFENDLQLPSCFANDDVPHGMVCEAARGRYDIVKARLEFVEAKLSHLIGIY